MDSLAVDSFFNCAFAGWWRDSLADGIKKMKIESIDDLKNAIADQIKLADMPKDRRELERLVFGSNDLVDLHMGQLGIEVSSDAWLDLRGYQYGVIDDALYDNLCEIEITILRLKGDRLYVRFLDDVYAIALSRDEDGYYTMQHNNGFCEQTSELYSDVDPYLPSMIDLYDFVDSPIQQYLLKFSKTF